MNVKREKQEMLDTEGLETKLKLTEFISVSELAGLLDVPVSQVITTCLSLGIIVSINQRLDAEIIELVAGEFGHEVEFISAEDDVEEEVIEEDDTENLEPRAPIVTVMGHVDHGKTSLLDFIRSANVVSGEAGCITQHIGAYEVKVGPNQKKITFLDTPGHVAFTAMRARGAKVTDVAVIIIAADDHIMPQTKEAISHAQAAGVPMVFAFNKIDKPGANSEKIREALSQMNILVEDWGGKFQSQEVSAKSGLGMDKHLEKVLLEAELLDLKANPSRNAAGTVIEASLDKGGGATSPSGTATTPTKQVGAPPPAANPTPPPTSEPSRAAPVSLPSDEWNCPWPDEAAELPIDEQTATIRVTVRADGSVESSEVIKDPGDGFAAAAIRCARRTRFTPAKDPEGRPIRAVSPPIRLHFYR